MQITAPCDLQYKTHKIQKDPERYYSFVFNDVMGLEDNTDCGVCEEDLNLALRGHVKEYYKVKHVEL